MTEATLYVAISSEPIDHDALRKDFTIDNGAGAVVQFEGWIRKLNHDRNVLEVTYEAYEPMAVKVIQGILNQASHKWPLFALTAVHRVGTLAVGECAVVVLASSRHRDECFAAVAWTMTQIKHNAPIWKKEYYTDGSSAWTRCHEHTRRGTSP